MKIINQMCKSDFKLKVIINDQFEIIHRSNYLIIIREIFN